MVATPPKRPPPKAGRPATASAAPVGSWWLDLQPDAFYARARTEHAKRLARTATNYRKELG